MTDLLNRMVQDSFASDPIVAPFWAPFNWNARMLPRGCANGMETGIARRAPGRLGGMLPVPIDDLGAARRPYALTPRQRRQDAVEEVEDADARAVCSVRQARVVRVGAYCRAANRTHDLHAVRGWRPCGVLQIALHRSSGRCLPGEMLPKFSAYKIRL